MKRIFAAALTFIALISFAGIGSVFAAPTAYIDPNTGGMLFQILAVAFTMLSGVLFFFSSRIKMAFNRMMRSFREKDGEDVLPEVDLVPDATQDNNAQS